MLDILWFLLAATTGAAAGLYARLFFGKRKLGDAQIEAAEVVKRALSEEQTILRQANDQVAKVLEDVKQEESVRRAEIRRLQERLEKRESAFDQQLLELEKGRKQLDLDKQKLETERQAVVEMRVDEERVLQRISGFSVAQAKDELFKTVEERMSQDLSTRMQKLEQLTNTELEQRSRTILASALQRYAGTHVSETTTTVVSIPSDDMKGRIIGKEGRNIKTLELMTGVEIMVDETPNSILVSGFNPLRRHIAKRAIERLVADGRIQPAKIEEAVDQAKADIADDIRQAGEDALLEVGVIGLDPKLVQILGRLKYRTSYGQNVLRHSIEVSLLAGMLAGELGADVSVAKKGGLLHDIGKAVDHEVQGAHPEIGYDILRKFGLSEQVAYIALSHHDTAPKTVEAMICLVADKLSGARPGARRDSLEEYITRLQDLERIATRNPGVERAFALSAGRELRVIVRAHELNDWQSMNLARQIANDIETELKYPGEIKVNVIREKRVIEYAR